MWYAAFLQYILYTCNISIWVKAALPVISGASNGPSGCLWYDKGSTKLPVEDITSLESCGMQLSNSIHYILVTSVYRSKRPFCWSLEHEIDHLVVCDMMSVPLSFQLRILYHWKLQYAGFQQNILYICNISILVEAALLVISGASNGPYSCLWYDEWPTELSVRYPTSLKSYDRQECNSTSNIFVKTNGID